MTQVRFVNKPARTFNNLMDDFFTGVPSILGSDFLATNGKQTIPVNIRETANDYILELIAPGFQKEDFMINLEKDLLTVSAESKKMPENETEKNVRTEYKMQGFKRSFTIDEKIDAASIVAKYINGVLTLNLPRKAEVKEAAKQISIQ